MNIAVGLVVLVAGLTILVTGWLAVTARLPRNHILGIRTRQTLSDPELWRAAHEEAGPWILAAGVADLLAGMVAMNMRTGLMAAILGCLAAMFTVILVIVGAAAGAGEASRRPH